MSVSTDEVSPAKCDEDPVDGVGIGAAYGEVSVVLAVGRIEVVDSPPDVVVASPSLGLDVS